MTTSPARTRRWTRAEYERLIDIGVFRADEPLELLGGELIVSEPQNSAHYTAIGLVEDALRAELAGAVPGSHRARRRVRARARRRGHARRSSELQPSASLAARARRRGLGGAPGLRPEAQGQPLRPCSPG